MRGLFITVEGIDGSGKSTQARLLAEALRQQGLDVLETREPGGTQLSEAIRALLLESEAPVSSAAEILLYAASRAQLVQEVLEPALEKGRIVVCDRFVDSSLAYQGYGLGCSLEEIRGVNQVATGGLEPDLTLLYDLPCQLALSRAGRDRIEQRSLEYYTRVREGYLGLAKESSRFRVIHGEGRGVEEIHQETLGIVCSQMEEGRT